MEALTARALELLLSVVEKENAVSPDQRKALRFMLGSMARQAIGLDVGRFAYGLPCGGGKTQGAIALIAASFELGLGLTFAVATSQVEALCEFKRHLMAAGVPEWDIGLWHSLPVNPIKAASGPGYASLPSTSEEDDRPVLLLSHEKIKRGNCLLIHGKRRDLLVWDESLIATQARAISITEIKSARALAEQYVPTIAPLLAKVTDVTTDELAALNADPERAPRLFEGILAAEELAMLRAALDTAMGQSNYVRAMRDTVTSLLFLLERPVSVVETGSGSHGDGVLRYDVLVSSELNNIAVLDASHAIRVLTQADRSIVDRTSKEMREYRRYRRVSVRLVEMATGNRRMSAAIEASLPAAREIAVAITEAPAKDGVLVFTFKGSLRHLRRNLEKLGVDLTQQITLDGERRPRIQFLTWGQETSRNDMRHCRLVIMAGVLRRGQLDLAASLTAQQQDGRPRRNSRDTLTEVMTAEMAHCVLQGIHRGACRVSDAGGEAGSTDVLILSTAGNALRTVLHESLPGAQWTNSEAVGGQVGGGKTRQTADTIMAYLASLGESESRVSVRAIKKAVGADGLGKDTFTTAINQALLRGVLGDSRWHREGRSLVRST